MKKILLVLACLVSFNAVAYYYEQPLDYPKGVEKQFKYEQHLKNPDKILW